MRRLKYRIYNAYSAVMFYLSKYKFLVIVLILLFLLLAGLAGVYIIDHYFGEEPLM